MDAVTRGQGGGRARPSEGYVGALGCEKERGEDARCDSIDNSGGWEEGVGPGNRI